MSLAPRSSRPAADRPPTPSTRRTARRAVASIAGLAVAASGLAMAPLAPAAAAPDDSDLVISEVFGGGGNSGAPFRSDFVELLNPTEETITLDGLALQYRSAGDGSGGVAALSGQVTAGSSYLVKAADGADTTAPALPDPDAETALAMAAGSGQVLLLEGTAPFAGTGDLAGADRVVDMVGYGSARSFETRAAPAPSNTTSVSRAADGADTDDNGADLTAGAPTPTGCGEECAPEEQPPAGELSIAEIQGTGAATPFAGQEVTTTGVVTASYPTGGFNGFVIQTGGTGGTSADPSPGASDAVFVWGGSDGFDTYPAIGDSVQVTATAVEGGGPAAGLTQLVPGQTGSVVELTGEDVLAPVSPTAIAYPRTDAAREALESMLVRPTGSFTVTNTFNINSFAEVGLASGSTPLRQPSDVANPTTDPARVAEIEADNAARDVRLDDGASVNFLTGASRNTALPYLSPSTPIRIGAATTFRDPVILEFRNSSWKYQPTTRLTAQGRTPATFANTRPANAAPRDVRGDLTLATFNVLNYFTTTGVDWIDRADASCGSFDNRFNRPITVSSCSPTGPRGAWDEENLERQEAKIVAGIRGLGADVVALEEIENSSAFGLDRDAALDDLVAALNEAAGAETWAAVPSPADVPASEDVIRNAMIYKPAAARPVGDSRILIGDPAYGNAREPLAQVFQPTAGDRASRVLVVGNHFKSKGGSGTGDNADTGQGAFNGDRTRQARALDAFADEVAQDAGVGPVFLVGDFNSYSAEDPMQVLYGSGYQKIASDTPGEVSYTFGGLSGSLDHVLANPAAARSVSGSDYWQINAVESVAFEYSRFNYNRTSFYSPDAFRSSDHDPQVVGVNVAAPDPLTAINLLSFNDFHGRINNSTSGTAPNTFPTGTAQFAGTIERLREQFFGGGEANTLLLSNGDNYGASEFNSAINEDVPTFDVLNALELDGSAVGNHEFDFGFDDLTERVTGEDGLVDFPYLGANVYAAGTQDPVLPEYATYEVDGVTVGLIGTVTQETPSLVSPEGIEGIEFGNAAEAADRVAAQLSDGDEANGEADVIVLETHTGVGGVGPDTTYAEALASADPDSEFAQMADISGDVDAIFNGHTHQQYAFRQPKPGGGFRPLVSAGQYGEAIGKAVLRVERATGDVVGSSQRVEARDRTATQTLVQRYPRVAAVQRIVDRAIADANVVGNEPVGEIAADITRARSATSTDVREEESTLGDLIGNALRDGVEQNNLEADLGFVNPGGIRADLLFAGSPSGNPANTDGVVTFAEANSVLPFTNNINLVDLTGAQLKEALEQQFQPDGSSRQFLHAGLSDNVNVTIDRSAPRGERITSIRIDDEVLDPTQTYTVSTFSFVAAGGDNFTAFGEGEVRDTGLVDRDLWIGYLRSQSQEAPIAPDYARQQVDETDLPESLAPGEESTFTLSRLDLTSVGSPANTSVSARLDSGGDVTDLGQVGTVTDGTSQVSVTVPADAPAGSVVELVAAPSGTTVTLAVGGDGGDPPVDPEPAPQATVLTWANPQPARPGQTVRLNARVLASDADGDALPVSGRVFVNRGNGTRVGVARVDADGRIQLRRQFQNPGTVFLRFTFRSDDRSVVRDSSSGLQVRVGR